MVIPLSEPLSPDEEAVCSRLFRHTTRGGHSQVARYVRIHLCVYVCVCVCVRVHVYVCWSAVKVNTQTNREETEQI